MARYACNACVSLQSPLSGCETVVEELCSSVTIEKQVDERFEKVNEVLGKINTQLADLEKRIEAPANAGCKCIIA